MPSYYTIVIIIAIVLLVVALTMVGLTLNKKNNKNPFPNYQNSCPDYWTIENGHCIPNGGINVPTVNQYTATKLGHAGVVLDDQTNPTKIVSLDLSGNNWTSICDKHAWANANGILWDGIANNNTCVVSSK